MSENLISSLHIKKLGHEILEIRERALLTIISKLEHGFAFDDSLSRSKEILTKLFEWFRLTPCTKQQLVFTLIKRILQSESGKILIEHHGNDTFKNEMQQVRSNVEPKYYANLEEILQILNEARIVVPPLKTDVPLSYRTGQSDFSARPVGTTATTIEGFVEEDSTHTQRNTPQNDLQIATDCGISHNFMVQHLRWQLLIETDEQVLQSIEESFISPPHPSSLLHSADFFINILLHDFPPEVFLQKPNVVFRFHDLINNCPSSRVTNSLLGCLINLTKALQLRIHYYKDPHLYTTKENMNYHTSGYSTSLSTSCKMTSDQSDKETRIFENVISMKTQRISFPQYCFSSFQCVFSYLCVKHESITSSRRKHNQKGINLALDLLNKLTDLLELVLSQDLWQKEPTPMIQEMRRQMNDVLINFGSSLEYFRIETLSDDSPNGNNRVTHLCLLHSCANLLIKMIPSSQADLILPRNLKNVLINSLVDVTLSKLYPNLHKTILDYVQRFKVGLDNDVSFKYRETYRICDSITAAVEFMKHWESFSVSKALNLAKVALPSLEFHQDVLFVKYVVELCATKLPLYSCDEASLETSELVILKLLSHNLESIREECYRICQKRVIAAVGPSLDTSYRGAPGSQILFMCRSNILIEVACHGLTSENLQIRNYSEDILIHIIKCKILVTDEIWNNVTTALIGSLPILLCHSSRNSQFGKSLLNILDPDMAETLNLPKIEVVKGNVEILFGTEFSTKEEAFSRLCWLLSTQKDSRDMLPRLNNLYDKALPSVCQIQRIVDINKNRYVQHVYQPSSLQQVLDLLKSPKVEPVIRRSALTQISVMLEDSLLHTTFLSNGGLDVAVNILKSALTEGNFDDYPDSVIPAISILKNVCLFQSSARLCLCDNIEIYFNILRSLFMFFTEEKIRQDASCLLFILIFNSFVRGMPSKANFSVPYLSVQKLQVPFTSNTHWERSQHYEESLVELLTSDKWCLTFLQIQWNCELFNGLERLLSLKELNYKETNTIDILKLQEHNLANLRASSISLYTQKYLDDIQNAVSHDVISDSIIKLTTYVYLHSLTSGRDKFLDHMWERTFSPFLRTLPSSEEDAKLLSNILEFLKCLLPFYRSQSERTFWLSEVFKDPSNCLLDLIEVQQTADEDLKTLSRDLLNLVTLCASQEQHFVEYFIFTDLEDSQVKIDSWRNVTGIIANILKFKDNTDFYNLAYLNSLLSSLTVLTASLGWTSSKPGSLPGKVLFQLVSSLCELVVVFQCGKGPTATLSFMGLSITRNAILILNHLAAEMQNFKLKNWERCFMEIEEIDWLKSFFALLSSRDVLLRAGILQLFAGLSASPVLSLNIANELKNANDDVWKLALNLLLDNDEASIVRENCASLLINLLRHTSLVPNSIFEYLEDFQFFKNTYIILSSLYVADVLDFDSETVNLLNRNSSEHGSSNDSQSITTSVVTPSLVKSVTNLFLSLSMLNEERFSYKLQDFGIVKILFKCIFHPAVDVKDTKKLAHYCEILQMDIAVCTLLNHLACVNFTCLGTLLHTRDCLITVVSLLDFRTYDVHLSQLVYLRNKLWSEIFKLLTTLTVSDNSISSNEAPKILMDVVEKSGRKAFVETMCEAIKNSVYDDLQSSALHLLEALLESEFLKIHSSNSHSSMQNILDITIAKRSNTAMTTVDEDRECRTAGAELCEILLYLYEQCIVKSPKDLFKKKSLITSSLTSLLCASQEAKKIAFHAGLPTLIIEQLKDCCLRLSLESVDCFRRISEKNKVCPILKQLNESIGLINNFMIGDELVKGKFAELCLSDFVHKLWIWFALQNDYILDVLKMLCTFTTDCTSACRSLLMTSSVAGSGPRKNPSKISLLHAIINLIKKETGLISKTRSLNVLNLSFAILKNCCAVVECRILICKSTLLNNTVRLHPGITKKQKPWDLVESIWLEFLETLTLYPEGQSSVAKISNVFDLILTLASTNKTTGEPTAVTVLRNIAFYQPNRTRLLTSDEFLSLLRIKLENGSHEEIIAAVLIMWTLAANSQKAKIIFKAAKLDVQLQQVLKHYEISSELVPQDVINTMKYVLNMIRDDVMTS